MPGHVQALISSVLRRRAVHLNHTSDGEACRENRWADGVPIAAAVRAQANSISYAAILGSLLFCPDCGTLLDIPKDSQNEVTCEQCGHLEPASCESPLALLGWTSPCSSLSSRDVQRTKTSKSSHARTRTRSRLRSGRRARRRQRCTKGRRHC